jgi:hypothetical protein
MVEDESFRKVMNVPFSVIVASFITIIVTSNMIDKNALAGLIGGYSGLVLGLFFIILLIIFYVPVIPYLDLIPIFLTLCIVSLLIYYLSVYFDKIATGEVSSYYNSFMTLSTIFLASQLYIINNSVYNKTRDMNMKLFSNTNYSLLVLFNLINSLIIITIGIVLRYYSTQGFKNNMS